MVFLNDGYLKSDLKNKPGPNRGLYINQPLGRICYGFAFVKFVYCVGWSILVVCLLKVEYNFVVLALKVLFQFYLNLLLSRT